VRRLLQRALAANRPMSPAFFRVVLAAGLALAVIAPHAALAQVTAIWYQAVQPNQLVGDIQPHLVQASDTVFFNVSTSATAFSMNAGSPATLFGLSMAGAKDVLRVGSFEGAPPPYYTPGPVLNFQPGNGFCGGFWSRFWIREVVPAGDGTLARFAADFEVDCQGGGTTYGEVRYNSYVPLSANQPGGWTTPDVFTLRTAGPVPAGVQGFSNTAYIYGINAPAPISIANGEYSINGGPFTSGPGTINNHDSIALRAIAQPGVPFTDATVNIGELSTSFRVLTYAPGDAFTAYSVYNIDAGSSTMEAWDAAARMGGFGYPNTLRVAWGTDASTYVDMDFEPGQSRILAPGVYELTSSTSYSSTAPLMSLDYRNMVCYGPGRFVILDYAADADGNLLRLAIDFEHRGCYGGSTFGEIRYNTTVPLSRFKPRDAAPDDFTLLAQNPMKSGDLALSNTISVMGTTQAQPISIAGGEYSVNGGAYTSAAGIAQPHDHITVRAHAPAADGATASATLAIGAVSRDFSLTSYAPGTTLSGLYLSTLGFMLAPMNVVRAQYGSIVVSPLVGDDLTVYIGSNLVVGQVYNIGSVSHPGTNCTGGTSRMYVRDAAYDVSGVATRFAGDFEWDCYGGPPLYAQVRFNSTVPFSELLDTTWRTDASVPRRIDLNGDGKSDYIIRQPNGSYTAVLMDGATTLSSAALTAVGGDLTILQVGDFDGDGKTDLIVENPDTSVEVWLMDGTSVKASATLMPAGRGWVVSHTGDFNGDGKTDLVWTNVLDGSVGVWLMDGISTLQRATMLVPHSGFSPIGVGDFDHDGKSDILWRNRDGTTSIWLMDGLTIREKGPVMSANTTWRAVKLGDFDGDGYTDILWQNLVDGSVSMWLMHGRTIREKGNVMPAGGWSPLLVGNFDADGNSDIVWRNTDGSLGLWLMNGRTVAQRKSLAGAGSKYLPLMLTDTDGNGLNEIVYEDVTNIFSGAAQWIVNGTTITGGAGVPTTASTLGFTLFDGHDYKH